LCQTRDQEDFKSVPIICMRYDLPVKLIKIVSRSNQELPVNIIGDVEIRTYLFTCLVGMSEESSANKMKCNSVTTDFLNLFW
jgi:hypothetical protein